MPAPPINCLQRRPSEISITDDDLSMADFDSQYEVDIRKPINKYEKELQILRSM